MSNERTDLMLDILKNIQADVSSIKREQTSLGIRLASIEDHIRGLMTSIYGMQADVADLKMRVDRIERRLGLNETEQ